MMDRALIIKQKWLDLIFCGAKTWEIRGSNTKIRGKIGLIESGSGLIVGECEIVDSYILSPQLFMANFHKHGVDLRKDNLKYKTPYAWALRNANRYDKPIPYNHPQGAVIWVKI